MVLTPREYRIFSRSFSQSDSSNNDNVIRNVSLITVGEAKGHDCYIDDTTLKQLLECSKKFKNGVRANLGHFTGMENSFGHITNIRISGEKLIGDLNMFEEHKDFALIKRNIKTIPDTFGFSVFFDGIDEEMEKEFDGVTAKVKFARCDSFMSSDLVTEPAANSGGVFERKFIQGPTARGQIDESEVDNKKDYMATVLENPEDLKKMISDCMSDCMASHKEHMGKMDDAIGELTKKVESIGTNDTPVKKDEDAADLLKKEGEQGDESPNGMSDDEKKDEKIDSKELAKRIEASNKALEARMTNAFLKALSDQKKSPPASSTQGSPASEKALETGKSTFKTYHEACRSVHALGKNSKIESMKLAAEQNPDLYKAYEAGQRNGEAWTREALFMTAEKKQRNFSIIASGRLI